MFEALGERLAAALKKISGRGVLRPEDVDAGLREVRLGAATSFGGAAPRPLLNVLGSCWWEPTQTLRPTRPRGRAA